MLADGDAAFVVFVDAVVVIALVAGPSHAPSPGPSTADSSATGSPFEEAFPLRSPTARFIGISTVPPTTSATAARSLTLLTSDATLVSVDVTSAQSFFADQPNLDGYQTRKLKSKIEQAIFFGQADNPLRFDLVDGYEGDLTAATLEIGRAHV